MRSNGIAVIALSVGLAAAGCNKRVKVATLPAAPPPAVASIPEAPPIAAPAPTPPPVPAPPPSVSALNQAERAFNSGSYEEAARGYENFLRMTYPGDEQRDGAIFQLALTYVLRPAPATDWQRAATTLKQLMEEYPNSSLKAPASLILSLHAEIDQVAADLKQRDLKIKQLTTELDRLKKIDADRRKRP